MYSHSSNEVDSSLAPDGIDRVVWVASDLKVGVDSKLDSQSTGLNSGAEGSIDLIPVVDQVLEWDKTATSLGIAAALVGEQAVLEGRPEVGILLANIGDGEETQLDDLCTERSKELVNLRDGQAWGKERLEHEHIAGSKVAIERVRVDALLNVLGNLRVVKVDKLKQSICLLESNGNSKLDSANETRFESLDGDRDDNSVCSSSSSGEGPEEILVGSRVGLDITSISKDNLEFESLISSHSVDSAQRRVATALDITSSQTDRWAFSSNNFESLGSSSLVGLANGDGGAELEGRSGVSRASELLNVLDGLEVASRDGERAGTVRLAQEAVFLSEGVLEARRGGILMTSVSDNQAEVVLLCKLDALRDILPLLCENSIRGVGLCRARLLSRAPWRASVVGISEVVRGEDLVVTIRETFMSAPPFFVPKTPPQNTSRSSRNLQEVGIGKLNLQGIASSLIVCRIVAYGSQRESGSLQPSTDPRIQARPLSLVRPARVIRHTLAFLATRS